METGDGTTLSADELALASKSSELHLEQLIQQSASFLHGCVHRHCGQTDSAMHDDMYSTALMGFYEAVRSFDAGKGHFYPFAEIVIQRRLTDAMRQLYRQRGNVVSIEEALHENGERQKIHPDPVAVVSIREHSHQNQAQQLRMEIEQFKDELAAWGIPFDVLVKQSPSHKRLREEYRTAVKAIARCREIMDIIWGKKYFPMGKISQLTNLSQKKLERGRSYIIASLIIHAGGYDYLSEYIGIKGG